MTASYALRSVQIRCLSAWTLLPHSGKCPRTECRMWCLEGTEGPPVHAFILFPKLFIQHWDNNTTAISGTLPHIAIIIYFTVYFISLADTVKFCILYARKKNIYIFVISFELIEIIAYP